MGLDTRIQDMGVRVSGYEDTGMGVGVPGYVVIGYGEMGVGSGYEDTRHEVMGVGVSEYEDRGYGVGVSGYMIWRDGGVLWSWIRGYVVIGYVEMGVDTGYEDTRHTQSGHTPRIPVVATKSVLFSVFCFYFHHALLHDFINAPKLAECTRMCCGCKNKVTRIDG